MERGARFAFRRTSFVRSPVAVAGSRLGGFAIAALLVAGSAHGQTAEWPARPVRVIVAQSPGGGTDIQARMFSTRLSESMGRQFLVENRTGAGNTIGFAYVAKAPPDGYTLLAVTPSFTFSPALYKDLGYDPMRDFAPISNVTQAPYLLLVNPSLPVRSVKEWIAHAKAQPGKLNAGVGGAGSFTHLAMAWLSDSAGVDVSFIPYKGTGPVLIDLMAGQLGTTFGNVLSSLPHVKSGKLRALATSMNRRSTVLPDLPTIAESGFPDYNLNTWHGWAGPAGTPAAIVNRMSGELARMVKSPQIAEQLAADGGEPVGSTPEEFRKLIASEVPRWRRVVEAARISIH
jgi:tripartite-type tricarboxylate transporter receptor subunit TctC